MAQYRYRNRRRRVTVALSVVVVFGWALTMPTLVAQEPSEIGLFDLTPFVDTCNTPCRPVATARAVNESGVVVGSAPLNMSPWSHTFM